MKLGSFASMGGEFFCKPCFKKNFFTKGNYSDGFGKLTPQQEHDMKAGKEPAVVYNATSFKGVNAAKTNSSPRSTIRVESEDTKKENDEKEARQKELSSIEEARKKQTHFSST